MFPKEVFFFISLLFVLLSKGLANMDYEVKVRHARQIVDLLTRPLTRDSELLYDLTTPQMNDFKIDTRIERSKRTLLPFSLDQRPVEQHFHAWFAPFELYECDNN